MGAPLELECHVISSLTVYELTAKVAERIQESFKPDVVVAISRGGFVPARLLCDFLQLKQMTSLGIKHYDSGARKGLAHLTDPLSIDVVGKNVLIVDDVNDTGDTLSIASEHVGGLGAADVRTAVIHEKNTTTISADFVAEKPTTWFWIVYPWALVEDVGEFTRKAGIADDDIEGAESVLASEYGIRLDPHELKRVLQFRWD